MRFDLNLKQLKIFFYVARHLNFRRASEELCISQPAVSMQVQALEEAFGSRLFQRGKNRIQLTEAGALLYGYAENIMRLAFEAEQAMEGLRANPEGVLRLGTTRVYARHLLPAHLLRFHEAFPRIRIQINEGSSEEMAMGLLYGRNDLAVVGRIPYDERLEACPFPGAEVDELLVVVPADHPLAAREQVDPCDLVGHPLIVRESGSATQHQALRRFEAEGLTPTIALEVGNVEFIKDLIQKGFGIGLLGRMAVDGDLGGGALVGIPIGGAPLAVEVDILVPKDSYRSVAVESFLGFLGMG